MAYLDDFLLQEIFVRLPVKSLHRFKCVSNHWLSLISDTRFVHEYVQFQSRRTNDDDDDAAHMNLHRTTFICMAMQGQTRCYLNFPSNALNFSFEFIPKELQQRNQGIELLAASHGWILCSSTPMSNPSSTTIERARDYYLCSPLLKQWIDIPQPPEPNPREFCIVGFMCEEDLIGSRSSNSNTKLALKPIQFKVVKTSINYRNILTVMVFSSENWKWRTSTITSKSSVYLYRVRWNTPYMVSCDGTLYWNEWNEWNERERCVSALDLDADGNPLHWHHIPLPDKSVYKNIDDVKLGLCQGQIHLSCWNFVRYSYNISIWKLIKEVDTDDHHHHYQWSLKHKIKIQNSDFRIGNVRMVDCAPLNGDIVYITCSGNQTVMFNLKNNTLTKIQKTEFEYGLTIRNSVPFVLPYWPLPLKTPKSQPSKKRTGGLRINSTEPKQKKLIL